MGRLGKHGLLFAVVALSLSAGGEVRADGAIAPAREPLCISGIEEGLWACEGERQVIRLETGRNQPVCINSYDPVPTDCGASARPASTAGETDGAMCLNGYGNMAVPCAGQPGDIL